RTRERKTLRVEHGDRAFSVGAVRRIGNPWTAVAAVERNPCRKTRRWQARRDGLRLEHAVEKRGTLRCVGLYRAAERRPLPPGGSEGWRHGQVLIRGIDRENGALGILGAGERRSEIRRARDQNARRREHGAGRRERHERRPVVERTSCEEATNFGDGACAGN